MKHVLKRMLWRFLYRFGLRDFDKRLADKPNQWRDNGEWHQRWLPGAFGEREDIRGMPSFVVEEDEWETKPDGSMWRTIKKARFP